MKKFLLSALICSLLILTVRADVTPPNSTGVEPLYSYKGGLNEAINLFNGNLNVTVPLLALKGRAGLDLNVVLSYDTHQMKFWSDDCCLNYADWNYTGRTMGRWVTTFYPYAKEYSEQSGGGYRWKAEITLEGGTQNQFDTGAYLLPPTKGIGHSTNTTDMQYDFDNHILRMKNGVWYRFPTTTDPTHTLKGDANGNYISYVLDANGKTTQIIDTLGRTVNISYDPVNTDLPNQITVLNNVGQTLTYSFAYEFKPVNPNAYGYVSTVNGTFPFLTQVNLPDGKTWSFSYYHQPSPGMPSTLLLAQVNYPMGGYSRYNYGNNNQMSAGLTQKIVNANNGQGEITTNYTGTGCATTCYVTVTAPDASYVVYLFDSGGRESNRIYYDASNRALKKMVTLMSADCYGLPRPSSVLTYINIAAPGATPFWQQVSTDSQTLDCVGNVTLEESTAVTPSTNFKGRRNTRVFLSLANYIYRVQQEIVYDLDSASNTTLVSRTDYGYDQFALTARSETGGIPGHDDANYGTGFTTRGNLTTVSRWLASESRSISTTSYYDILGNVVQQSDPKNYSTTINYSQTFHFAYPTQVINPKGHTVNTNYSSYTGQVTSVTNANNFTTTTTYDSLNRVSRIDNPDGGYIRATYDLTANNFSTTVYKSVATGQESNSTTYLDGIGREKQKKSSDPAGDIYVDTQYYVCDCNGKTSKVSNPYRLGETVYWTETQYDALGRPTKIIPPDGSSSSNNTRYYYYDASNMTSVLVTDPTGKQRKYDHDVVGRTNQGHPRQFVASALFGSAGAPLGGFCRRPPALFLGGNISYPG
jgi:YD repeat-containing protein